MDVEKTQCHVYHVVIVILYNHVFPLLPGVKLLKEEKYALPAKPEKKRTGKRED